LIGLMGLAASLQGAVSLEQLAPAEAGKVVEFRAVDVPVVANPFDDELIRVDATFAGPDARTWVVPAFWYQGYARRLSGGTELLSLQGAPEWRVRFTSPTTGEFRATLTATLNGQPPVTSPPLSFTVSAAAAPVSGFVQVATNRSHFCLSDGRLLPLIGHCVCWHHARGTYDYDDWLGAMQRVGENYTRLWMCPWAFGLEAETNTLTRYRLDRAWQLDYVFRLAEQRGLYLMLCFDYHGMFETEPDYWGGNNFWPKNPYNAVVGGPCTNQNHFFTSAQAKRTYQKRLRYLVARYGASPNLLAWQFFNEIDNVYRYLNPTNVATWHAEQGDWLHANDPFRHLVTTSLTGGSDRPEIWSLPQMDFSMYHSYGQPDPALGLAARVRSFRERYAKPMMIGEFGVDWQGWDHADDPFLRGMRQGVWAGVVGGSVGTSMSWWWEAIHNENLYPLYQTVRTFLGKTHLGRGSWEPVTFRQSGLPPATVGPLASPAAPFSVQLALDAQWGPRLRGTMAVPDTWSAGESPGLLNSFVHGTGHPDLRIPFRLNAWFDTNASLTLHVNSVSDGAVVNVRVDNASVFTRSLPNLDGTYQVNNEYNTNLVIAVPAGQHVVEVRNAGGDWFCLDWVALSNVLTATYDAGWTPEPVAIGIRGEGETLVYVASPLLKHPARVTNAVLPTLQGVSVTLSNWPSGTWHALWYHATNAAGAGQTLGTTTDGRLTLPLPEFSEDLVGRLVREFAVQAAVGASPGTVRVAVVGDRGLEYELEGTTNLEGWSQVGTVSNALGEGEWEVASDPPLQVFRGRVKP
jgi:hypothetical protein